MFETTQINPLHEIAEWATTKPRDWSQNAYAIAERSLIDTIACALAGANESSITKLVGLVSSWGHGPSTLIGHGPKLAAPWAALVNGAAAHVLDFDDNFDPSKAHASAVLIPALLAVGEQENASIEAVLDGYIVGLQVMGHVGQAVNPFHRNRGWHATATMGAIGAAAGAARLLGLNTEQTAHAISMATSRAGGFMSQFGTDTKPLHAGFAASGGVQSALMAEAGLTAGADTLDGPTGLRTLMVGPDVEACAAEMQGTAEHGQSVTFVPGRVSAPLHIETYGLKIKRFPNCGSVHRALDGLLSLWNAHQVSPDKVDHVLVRAPASHLRNLMYDDPQTPAQAKFSLEYNLAVGLLRGSVGLSDFEMDMIGSPEPRALLGKIRKEYVERLESEFPTEVHIHMTDGAHYQTRIEMPVGSKQVPMTNAQLFDKFEECVRHWAKWPKVDRLRTRLEQLDQPGPISDLTELLRS